MVSEKSNSSSFYFLSIFPVPISFEPIESVITVKEDQDIAIPCDVDGFPEPTTQWYHNGISLQEKLLSTSIFLLPFLNLVLKWRIFHLQKKTSSTKGLKTL